MEYMSIDIETTGLDEYECQTIEFGAILENTLNPLSFDETPKFHAIIRHDNYEGSAFAINMNQRIFKIFAERPNDNKIDEQVAYDTKYNIVHVENFAREFYNWCMEHVSYKPKNDGDPFSLIAAGKNFATFDARFLNVIYEWDKYFSFHRRTLDPAILFWNPTVDRFLPNLEQCLERAGIEDTIVTHDAIKDAWQVIEVLRTKYESDEDNSQENSENFAITVDEKGNVFKVD
jgi:hypothetical protein